MEHMNFTLKGSKWRNFEHIRMIMHIEKAANRYKLLFSNAGKASSILARTLHTLSRAGVSVS
jgi:sigma54-dependent transcription regulator